MARDEFTPRVVTSLAELLVKELDLYVQDNPVVSPEALINFLFTTGSHIAARTCLQDNASFPVSCFRVFCSIVHVVCKSVAEQYSHIDLADRARRLAHRWLFYGDQNNPAACNSSSNEPIRLQGLDNIDEEITSDFIMDLSIINTTEGSMGTSAFRMPTYSQEDKGTISTEESSALCMCSDRELSEAGSQRAAIRISFVLAFSALKSAASTDEVDAKENLVANHRAKGTSTGRRLGILHQLQTKRDSRQDCNVSALGLELLQIVFAKSSVSSNLLNQFRLNNSASSAVVAKRDGPSTITFAMRHRALRAASILCPQDVLEEIIRNERFLRPSNNSEQCTLRQCSFGVFLAKEIEEIGLPLPHSDLLQLSSMHFLSYARALWRDHREDSILEKSKGRFLLLLVEMSLVMEDTDSSFVNILLDEMIRLNLVRSLLIALEHIAEYLERVHASLSFSEVSIKNAVSVVADGVLLDMNRLRFNRYVSENHLEATEAVRTVERLFKVTLPLLDSNSADFHCSKFLRFFAETIDEVSVTAKSMHSIVFQARHRAERYNSTNITSGRSQEAEINDESLNVNTSNKQVN
jgi:hypothetical protein